MSFLRHRGSWRLLSHGMETKCEFLKEKARILDKLNHLPYCFNDRMRDIVSWSILKPIFIHRVEKIVAEYKIGVIVLKTIVYRTG